MPALLGLPLLYLSVQLLAGFPIGRLWLGLLGTLLFAAQWRYRHTWLLALPALLPLLDLAPWSGRVLLDEYDVICALLAAAALFAGHYEHGFAQLKRRTFFPLWLLPLSLALSTMIGLWPWQAFDANAQYAYLSGWNALRVAKGPLWALVFLPLLLTQFKADRDAVESRFAMGVTLGLLGFGLVALWEKGFFFGLSNLFENTGLFGNWISLSGHQRLTGLFSQMNFGGAAAEAYLVIAWPFALYFLVKADHSRFSGIAALALGLFVYALAMTFDRAAYAAASAAVLLFAAGAYRAGAPAAKSAGFPTHALVLYLPAAFIVFVVGFRFGGITVLAAYTGAMIGGVLTGLYRDRLPRPAPQVLTGLLLVPASALAASGIILSPWAHPGWPLALAIALPSCVVIGFGGLGLGHRLHATLCPRNLALAIGALTFVLVFSTLALSGFRTESRAEAASGSLQSIWQHWKNAIGLMPHGDTATLLGSGLGGYPSAGLVLPDGVGRHGTFHFLYPGRTPILRLVGNGDLRIGQRLTGIEPGIYRLRVRASRVSGSPALSVEVSRRGLIEPFRVPAAEGITLDLEPGPAVAETLLNLRSLGAGPWYEPEYTVLSLGNRGADGSMLDLETIELIDESGDNRLKNGDFSAGGDFWLPYNDTHHHPWHLRSFFVNLYFDSGVFGLLAWLLPVFFAVTRIRHHVRHGSLFASAVLAALGGTLALGLFESPLELPRIMTLFVLLVCMGLWRQRLSGRKNGRERRRASRVNVTHGNRA